MFKGLFASLSIRRSLAGIYYELRSLRQLKEIEHEALGFQSLSSRRAADRYRPVLGEPDIPIDSSLDEEALAREAALEIQRKRNLGIDPGTDWQRDPNR